MKKISYIVFILGLLTTSCNKPPVTVMLQEVVFKATTSDAGIKSSSVCDNPVAHYALISIQPLKADDITLDGDPINKKMDVFYLNGIIYTGSFNLPAGNFNVTSFVLKNDNGTLNDTTDDITVFAVPVANSDYANFVNATLPLNFTVGAFMKNEVPIQVLCFTPANFANFGFSWFQFNPIAVHTLSFFGNICIDNPTAYQNTAYNIFGSSSEIPAIFKIDVYLNDAFLISYNNESWFSENAVLNVQYPDYEGTDNYKFVLSIKVLVGTQLQYVPYYTWKSTDAGALMNENNNASTITNGVLDFVLGTCDPNADLIIQ